MFGRDGSFSLIRVGTIAAIIGILVVAGGVVSFFLDRASHQVPLEVAPYPGATTWGQRDHSPTSRTVYYQVPGIAPEEVVDYYQRKLDEMFGNNQEKCERFPTDGNFPEYDDGVKGIAPYQFSCMFDRSGFQITQYTRINIQPGVDANQGTTIVAHEQFWQP